MFTFAPGHDADSQLVIFSINEEFEHARLHHKLGRVGAGNFAVIFVRMSGPTFQNPPCSYTRALEIGTH